MKKSIAKSECEGNYEGFLGEDVELIKFALVVMIIGVVGYGILFYFVFKLIGVCG